jgi:hypothetical protein
VSSRPLVIAGIVGGILAGVALFVVTIALVAIEGPALSAQVMAILMLAGALGLVLDATWLTLAVAQLGKLDHGSDDDDGEGGGGWGRPRPDPARPRPPSEDPDWWPEFERDLRAHLEARDDTPIAS